jgi:hypothetical protein
MRAFDDEVRRFHGAGHLSQLVLRLGPGFELEAFCKLVAAVTHATPILRAPVRRRFGFGVPVYRLSRAPRVPVPSITVHEAQPQTGSRDSGDKGLPALFRERLNIRLAIERGELLRFDLVSYDGGRYGTDLAMTWAHLLLDGTGSEFFIRRLEECFRGQNPVADLRLHGSDPSSRSPTPGERVKRAREWQARMIRLSDAPPHSLGGPRRRIAQSLCYEVVTLSRAETTVVAGRAAEYAGYFTPVVFYLAAAIRAHDAVFTRRGEDPGHYLIPLPVNLRRKGVEGAIFRTNISLLWFSVAREYVADFAGLVGELMRQRRASIRDGLVEKGSAAMDLLRVAPARLHSWLARHNLSGEIASFYFAFTNDFLPGMDAFFGAEILNGFHAPSVMPSPGSSVTLSVRDGRLNVTLLYQRGAVRDDERQCLREQLLDDLLGRPARPEAASSAGRERVEAHRRFYC